MKSLNYQLPNRLRLRRDGRLVMDDGSSVEAYLKKYAKLIKIPKDSEVAVIVQPRVVAQEILFRAELVMVS